MPGSKTLRKLQLGKEATFGTAVAATAIWRGLGVLEDTREQEVVEEDVGVYGGADRSHINFLAGALEMEAVPATFEQLSYIGEAGIKKIGTGAADGAGTDKIYDYAFPTTASPTLQSYTIEGGDNQEAEEMEYSLVEEFTLEGEAKKAWTMAAKWFGRQIVPSTFTGSLTIPTVEDILFGATKLYIDAIGGTFGTTVKSNTLLKASLKYKTGAQAVYLGDNLYFTLHKVVTPEVILEVTFEHDGSATAEKVNWRAQTPRLIQVKCEGSTVATPGTVYSKKTMIINVAGRWTKFDKLDEQDGNDIVMGTFTSRYNPTAAKFGNLIVVNELTTIP